MSVQLCVWLRLRQRQKQKCAGGALPAVTVLKPIKGADAGLRDNLEALLAQDYPDWQLIIAVAERDDPAYPVALELVGAHPDKEIRVVTGAPAIGLNPKVCNLAHASKFARHDWWLISDADARPHPTYLREMVAPLHEGARLVHSVLAPSGERSLGAALDNAHVCGWIGPSVCAADLWMGHPCVIGKSILLHRGDLRRLGGWRRYLDVLAEDYLLGRDFWEAGMPVAIAERPLCVHTAHRSLTSFVSRHVRWSQMRRSMRPWVYALEPVLYPTPLLMAAAGLALVAGARDIGIVAVGLVAVKVALDAAVARRLRGHAFAGWVAPLIPVKDLLLPYAWLSAWLQTRVDWRGHRMRIGPGTRLVPCADGMRAKARRAWQLAQRVFH